MSPELACPTCAERYRDEDFCPKHGARLVPCPQKSELGAPSVSDGDCHHSGSDEEQEHDVASPEVAAVTSDREGESKLLKFMNRLRLRPIGTKPHSAANEGKSQDSPAGEVSPLPNELVKQGWTLAGPAQGNADIDRWQTIKATDDGPTVGLFQRYRTGALTAETTYHRLEKMHASCLAEVRAHGTVDFGGARADYDLVVLPKYDNDLEKCLADTPASEQRATHVLPLVVRLLRELDAVGIRPMVIEPAQLLRLDDGSYCMSAVGALADATAPAQFHPEFMRSALLPRCWVAPELVQQTILSTNAAVFSLGQILAQAVWGQPCSHDELQTGAVPFHAVGDDKLARVLMGCLWPRSTGRWTYDDLFQAVDCVSHESMPLAAPWASLAPGASSHSFSFAGESFWRLEELLALATTAQNWREAAHNIRAILDWAESTAWAGQARLLREALGQRRSPDWVLIALARAVRPDAPISWRELDLSDAEAARSLVGLAQSALQGSAASSQTLSDLFNADLRSAFTQVSAMPLHQGRG